MHRDRAAAEELLIASHDINLPVLNEEKKIRRSKSGRRRAIVLGIVQVLIIAHIIQWAITGTTITPIEPSESMEFVKKGVINVGTIFFAVAILSTLLLGRWFCGWGCHLVLLQDLCGWMLRKIGIRPRPFRSRLLMWVPFILAIYMFILPVVWRLGIAPLSGRLHQWMSWIPDVSNVPDWPGISVHLVTDDFWKTFAGPWVAIPFLLICGFATVYFLGNKGFCTYGCPYGGFFAPADQYAPGRIRVTDACEHCGHCTAVCTSNVRVHEEVKAYGMVVDPGCMKCMDCVSVCPKDALYFGFGKPASGAKARAERPKARWDLSWPEEIAFAIVFLGTFAAWRGIYGFIPMLMAAGIGGCVTFIVFKAWRTLRRDNEHFHRRRLRFRGELTASGRVWLAAAAMVIGLTVHSGVIQLMTRAAERADGLVNVPRTMIFTAAPTRLPDEMAADARRALDLYDRIEPLWRGGFALAPANPGLAVATRRAWLLACLHEFASAEAVLREDIERNGPNDFACLDIAFLLQMQLDDEGAAAYLAEITRTHPEFQRCVDAYSTWLAEGGRRDDAIALVESALASVAEDDPRHLAYLRRLSLLALEGGDALRSVELIERTIEIDPNNPGSYVFLTRAYEASGNSMKAMEAVSRGLERFPEDPALLELRAAMGFGP